MDSKTGHQRLDLLFVCMWDRDWVKCCSGHWVVVHLCQAWWSVYRQITLAQSVTFNKTRVQFLLFILSCLLCLFFFACKRTLSLRVKTSGGEASDESIGFVGHRASGTGDEDRMGKKENLSFTWLRFTPCPFVLYLLLHMYVCPTVACVHVYMCTFSGRGPSICLPAWSSVCSKSIRDDMMNRTEMSEREKEESRGSKALMERLLQPPPPLLSPSGPHEQSRPWTVYNEQWTFSQNKQKHRQERKRKRERREDRVLTHREMAVCLTFVSSPVREVFDFVSWFHLLSFSISSIDIKKGHPLHSFSNDSHETKR